MRAADVRVRVGFRPRRKGRSTRRRSPPDLPGVRHEQTIGRPAAGRQIEQDDARNALFPGGGQGRARPAKQLDPVECGLPRPLRGGRKRGLDRRSNGPRQRLESLLHRGGAGLPLGPDDLHGWTAIPLLRLPGALDAFPPAQRAAGDGRDLDLPGARRTMPDPGLLAPRRRLLPGMIGPAERRPVHGIVVTQGERRRRRRQRGRARERRHARNGQRQGQPRPRSQPKRHGAGHQRAVQGGRGRNESASEALDDRRVSRPTEYQIGTGQAFRKKQVVFHQTLTARSGSR